MPTRGEAFRFLEDEAPHIFGSVESMLYVGHRGDTSPWWHETLARRLGSPRLGVIDVNHGNLQTARHVTSDLYLGDVRSNPAVAGYALIFWDEGPEHLPRDESLALVASWRDRGQRILLSCPWGFMPQGSGPDDPEFHHWGPTPEDFSSIGFGSATFGNMFHDGGRGHGNLIAWA